MKKYVLSAAIIIGLFGCKSTAPEVEYLEKNYGSMSSYNSLNNAELASLTKLINDECVFKRMESKNLNYSDLISIPINGIVIYDLTDVGIVSSALYVSKDQRSVKIKKQKCIESVSLGYQLPPSKDVEKVFTKFNVNIE